MEEQAVTQQVVKCRYIIPTLSTAMDDVSVDFIFEATGSDTNLDFTTAETPGAALDNFWNGTATGQVNPISSYISAEYSRATNACTLEFYDITAHLSGTPAGAPFRIDHGTLSGAAAGTDLHPALCGVIAYRRDYGTDQEHAGATRPRARDRGRIHIGPLRAAALADGTGKATPGFASDLLQAAKGLAQVKNALSANQFNWVQWSRKNASVAPIADVAMQYGLGILRGRVDEQNTRILGWQSVV